MNTPITFESNAQISINDRGVPQSNDVKENRSKSAEPDVLMTELEKKVSESKETEPVALKDVSAEFAKKDKKEQEEELDQAIEIVSDFMSLSTQTVNFQKDDSSDKTIIKVFDSASNELIKQFPSEAVLEIAQKIVELSQDVGVKTGILLDEKV